MKSVIKGNPSPSGGYPKLMANDDLSRIVLMTSFEVGVVVRDTNGVHGIGEIHKDWAMFCFTDFNGTVELSNT